MGKICTQCPSCSSTKLHVSKIQCEQCKTTFEGNFELPSLLKLPEPDLQFMVDFVKCSGSLKDMATQQKVSYPTLRNRLNHLIETLEKVTIPSDNSKVDILKLLEEGKISAIEAANMLKQL